MTASPDRGFPDVCIHVCVTCKAGESCADEDERPGLRFRRALEAALAPAEGDAGWITVKDVACLASCARGCAAAISMPGKWSYLLGGLGPAKAADFLAYARSYRASKTGLVLPSKRPASLCDAVLGRMPPLVPAPEEPA